MARRIGFWSGLRIGEVELAMVRKMRRPGRKRKGFVKKVLRNRLRRRLVVGRRARGEV